jgi:hypothetical protein
MVRALPSPQEPWVDDKKKVRVPWYQYLKDIDNSVRPTAVTTIGSTSDVIPNSGITLIQTTAASTHTMSAPEAGVEKTIVRDATTGFAVAVTSSSTTIKLYGLAGGPYVRVSFPGTAQVESLTLVGISTSRWLYRTASGVFTYTT